MKKDNYMELFDNIENTVQIFNGVKNYNCYLAKPERKPLFFGCNYDDIPTVVIKWSEKGRGFGEYAFQLINGRMVCHNECDSPETVKRILCMMVDQCEFSEPCETKKKE